MCIRDRSAIRAKAAWGTAPGKGARGARSTWGARGTWSMRDCFRRSELGLRGPRNRLKHDQRSSEGGAALA
eukprot:4688600-Alexandrium_andersonii.AAC.1